MNARTEVRAALLALAALAGACRSGPDFIAPTATTTPAWAASDASLTAAPVAHDGWWLQLGAPPLESLVARALADNRDLRAAAARIRQARAAAGQASAAALPQFDAAGGYTRTRTTEATPSPVRGRNYDTWTLGFDASWELDLFGRLARESEARTAEAALATADAQAVREALIAEVVATYADLVAAAQRRAVALDGEAAATALLELTRSRAQGGVGNDLDSASAERLLGAARARKPVHDREWTRARNRLAVLLGLAPQALDVDFTAAPTLAVPDVVAIGLPADLVRRRPDLAAAEQRLHAATARLGSALADRWPRLSITGFFGLEANRADSLLENGSRAMRAGPSLRLPLFTGGSVQEQIAVREAQLDEVRADLEQTVLRAFEEVENAASALQHERHHTQALADATAAATRARTFAQQRFDAGLDNFLTVLTAEQERLDLADQLAAAQGEVARQYVALQKALGSGVPASEPATVVAAGDAQR